jgi:hypothetical protein
MDPIRNNEVRKMLIELEIHLGLGSNHIRDFMINFIVENDLTGEFKAAIKDEAWKHMMKRSV